MSRWRSRWFLISLIHPILSMAGFITVWLIFYIAPSTDRLWLKTVFGILKYLFMLNAPGHWFLQKVYEAPGNSSWITYMICFCMVALTWAFFVMPVCFAAFRGWTRSELTSQQEKLAGKQ